VIHRNPFETDILMKQRYFLTYLVLVSFIYSGCVSVKPFRYDDDKRTADELVRLFHKNYNENDFESMYKISSPKIQSQQDIDGFRESLLVLRKEMGLVVESKIIKTKITTNAANRVVNSVYETKFERGVLEEEFDCSVGAGSDRIEFYGHPSKY
jgi:hypothetical protein